MGSGVANILYVLVSVLYQAYLVRNLNYNLVLKK